MTKFTGDGFSKEELSEEERARHREAYREYEKDFPMLRKAANLFRSWPLLGAIGGGLFGFAMWLRWWLENGGSQ